MKRVRFETPPKPLQYVAMNDFECQSPRPLIARESISAVPDIKYDVAKVLPYSNDPLQRYECGNGSPYPKVNKTSLTEISKVTSNWCPSNDLELSMLDSCGQMPRRNLQDSNMCTPPIRFGTVTTEKHNTCNNIKANSRVLSSLENKYTSPPNVLSKHDDFFLQRENLRQLSSQSIDNQLKKLSLNKENNPIVAKADLMKIGVPKSLIPIEKVNYDMPIEPVTGTGDHCRCHNCIQGEFNDDSCDKFKSTGHIHYSSKKKPGYCNNSCYKPSLNKCTYCNCQVSDCIKSYKRSTCNCDHVLDNDINAIDKKTWVLKRYEESKAIDTLDIEKQGVKEKREPTVADLFKIIKLQNEQLQLLQDKVDKFISASKFEPPKQALPLQNYITEHVAVETTMDKEHHKISIGVMTSFEVVRTSTIINKEIVKQSNEAQIQCNRSQISIKDVQPASLNFLDGIMPVAKPNSEGEKNMLSSKNDLPHASESWHKDNVNVEKTFNEMSLYNIQVDNATTPLMSPEQSMYLDVQDYSDSESDDQSNVGWTYYNKVMTHVNGMLHDSDMPSSASALYRNTRQKCMQMKIDKTNVSVIKRVKFGDDPIGIHQQHVTASTDTSLKMNQLAAKYLRNGPYQTQAESPRPNVAPIDMSFATRNYMEKHQLLQGLPMKSNPAQAVDLPRFLDITALKQQPKLM